MLFRWVLTPCLTERHADLQVVVRLRSQGIVDGVAESAQDCLQWVVVVNAGLEFPQPRGPVRDLLDSPRVWHGAQARLVLRGRLLDLVPRHVFDPREDLLHVSAG